MLCLDLFFSFDKIDFIVSKNDWISSEQQYFGQPNTAYDFTAHDPKEVQRKMSKLQEQKVREY